MVTRTLPWTFVNLRDPQPWAHDPVFIMYGGYVAFLTPSTCPCYCAIPNSSAVASASRKIPFCFRCVTYSGISVGVGEFILYTFAFTLVSPHFLGLTLPISTFATARLTLSPRLRYILTPDEQPRMDRHATPFSPRAVRPLDRVRPRAVRKETVRGCRRSHSVSCRTSARRVRRLGPPTCPTM